MLCYVMLCYVMLYVMGGVGTERFENVYAAKVLFKH